MGNETQRVDVLAVLDRAIDRNIEKGALKGSPSDKELRKVRAAVAELIKGPYSQMARLGHLLDALRLDDELHGSRPDRSALDFPHAIRIVEMAIAALANLGAKP